MLRPLDLSRQWAVVPDQRGAGASRPRGRIARNTTAALVSDLEALRKSLGVERWNVFAGSWGTVVALAYAQRHPERVERMVLRGAFGVTRRELAGLLQPRSGVRHRPGSEPLWPRAPGYGVPSVLAALRQVVQSGTLGVAGLRAVRHWNRLEMACARLGMRRSLRHAAAQGDAALGGAHSARCGSAAAGLAPREERRRGCRARGRPTSVLRNKYRVQGHYLLHRGFVRPGAAGQSRAHSRAQGYRPSTGCTGGLTRCAPAPTASVGRPWCQVPGQPLRLHLTRCGHLGHEADTLDALRRVVRSGNGRSAVSVVRALAWPCSLCLVAFGLSGCGVLSSRGWGAMQPRTTPVPWRSLAPGVWVWEGGAGRDRRREPGPCGADLARGRWRRGGGDRSGAQFLTWGACSSLGRLPISGAGALGGEHPCPC